MEILVLGGTHHVGRNVVDVALQRGHSVTTLNRGTSGPTDEAVRHLRADRTDRGQLEAALVGGSWDAVVDTWSGPPAVVGMAAQLLAGRVGHLGYVSSRSVHRWPLAVGLDESGPVVDADPASPDEADYARCKRGGELAVLDHIGDGALVARPGLILGPCEQKGRLPWWLRRMERGGVVLCPGPEDLALQCIDGRDLAGWMLDMAAGGRGGIFNTVSEPGHTTMGELLTVCRRVTASAAQLAWTVPERIEQAGIEPWTELPIWIPPGHEGAGLHAGDVRAALAAGLGCRPIGETVADTWAWMAAEGDPASLADGSVGLAPEKEQAALAPPPGR